MKIAITVPLYMSSQAHFDYLNILTQSIQTQYDFVWIPVINHMSSELQAQSPTFNKQPILIDIVQGRQPQAVSKAWNDGILKAVNSGCEYIFVLNSDIKLRGDSIDNLIRFAQNHPEGVLYSMAGVTTEEQLYAETDENFSEHPNFQAFMVKKDFIMQFGQFDENFQAGYFEDNDCHGRLALENKKAYIYGGSRELHYGSQSTKNDAGLAADVANKFTLNRNYFMTKWGAEPIGDSVNIRNSYYRHPYNDASKPMNYWHGHPIFENMSKPYEEYIKNFQGNYFANQEISHYDNYDWEHMKGVLNEYADNALEYFNLSLGSTVLDAGCAKGYLVKILKERGLNASGFDISDYAIEEAKKEEQNCWVGDITDMSDIKDNSYDLITVAETIEHIPTDMTDKVLQNLYRCSRKYVLLSIPLKTKESDIYEDGEKTHINIHTREWWNEKLAPYFDFITNDNLFKIRWNFFPLIKKQSQ